MPCVCSAYNYCKHRPDNRNVLSNITRRALCELLLKTIGFLKLTVVWGVTQWAVSLRTGGNGSTQRKALLCPTTTSVPCAVLSHLQANRLSSGYKPCLPLIATRTELMASSFLQKATVLWALLMWYTLATFEVSLDVPVCSSAYCGYISTAEMCILFSSFVVCTTRSV